MWSGSTDDAPVVLTLLKTTEPFLTGLAPGSPVQLLEWGLQGVRPAASAGPAPERRVDVYGDSDSAGYGVDGSPSEVVRCLVDLGLSYENWGDGWVRQAMALLPGADGAAVDVRVQAVSGIGVVENAVGAGTPSLSSATMLQILRRTLQTVDVSHRHLGYHVGPWPQRASFIIIIIAPA